MLPPVVSIRPVNESWQEAFLGVGALLGEPLEESLRALEVGAADGPPRAHDAGELGVALRSPSRRVRAQAIARAVMGVAVGLEQMRLPS